MLWQPSSRDTSDTADARTHNNFRKLLNSAKVVWRSHKLPVIPILIIILKL